MHTSSSTGATLSNVSVAISARSPAGARGRVHRTGEEGGGGRCGNGRVAPRVSSAAPPPPPPPPPPPAPPLPTCPSLFLYWRALCIFIPRAGGAHFFLKK